MFKMSDERVPASGLFFSDDGLELLKSAESIFLKPYNDQTGKPTSVWVPGATIGYGHLITQNQWATYQTGFSQEDAEALLVHDLAPSVTAVQNTITALVTQNEFDAMVILTFNIGTTGFNTSTVAKLVNNPDAESPYPTLKDAWMAWDRSQGNVMQGLVNRRNCEWNVFANAVYAPW